MLAGGTQPVGDAGAANVGGDHAIRVIDKTRVGGAMLAEAEDVFAGLCGQAGEIAVVAIEDRGAAGLESLKYFGLGVGNRGDRAEIPEMRRGDRRDDRDMRSDDRGQRRDFARVVHAELEYAELGLASHARER